MLLIVSRFCLTMLLIVLRLCLAELRNHIDDGGTKKRTLNPPRVFRVDLKMTEMQEDGDNGAPLSARSGSAPPGSPGPGRHPSRANSTTDLQLVLILILSRDVHTAP